jgi:hypothetical protein
VSICAVSVHFLRYIFLPLLSPLIAIFLAKMGFATKKRHHHHVPPHHPGDHWHQQHRAVHH